MADIKPAEISAIIKKQLTGSEVSPSLDEVGTVLQVGDGISRVYGLSNVQFFNETDWGFQPKEKKSISNKIHLLVVLTQF